MKYVGSKNRIAKHILPIIQNELKDKELYLEPFVGGANMIDKVVFDKKIGSDINNYLISLLQYIQNEDNVLPKTITEEEYNKVKNNKYSYDEWYVGLVGFCATFGAKWFGGYARSFKKDKLTPRDMSGEAITNLEKQRSNLKDITFFNCSYESYKDIKNAVVYCDIPYKNSLQYKDKFDHDKFYEWCDEIIKNNNVIILSEYEAPENFECVLEIKHKVGINQDLHKERIEKVFILK